MKQPRVTFVTRKWAPAIGGMETYSHRLCEALARRCTLEVIALPGRGDGMPPSAASLLHFPFTVACHLAKERPRPDVLHLGDMALWPLALLGLLVGKPDIILSAHGTDVAFHRRGGLKGRLYGAYLRLGAHLLRRAKVIANSRATAVVLRETGWRDAAVIPLATDMGSAPSRSGHNGRLLFVGRLVERKGCGWFVREVLPLLPEGIELDVAGTGWSESERNLIANKRVNFLGPLHGEALMMAYRDALAVIIPNVPMANGEYEGFGLVAPEAAAAGGIVLASDCDGLRDAVIDGETGTLLPPANAGKWSEAVASLLRQSDADRLANTDRARDSAQRVYSWDRVAQDTLAIYESI